MTYMILFYFIIVKKAFHSTLYNKELNQGLSKKVW